MEGKEPGTHLLYPRSPIGEPAEFERVMRGIAQMPTQDVRWMSVNGVKQNLPMDHWDCDGCGGPIKPGDRCGTWTVWTEEHGGIAPWEHAYLMPGASGAG